MPEPNAESPVREWTENILDVHGEIGRDWLSRLPDVLAVCAERWDLELQAPFGDLSYNYVTPAVMNGSVPVVLKAGVPGPEINSEIEAVQLFDGTGMSRMLHADSDLGVMLLERVQPGTFLSDLDDDEAIVHHALSVLKKLCRPAPVGHALMTVSEWASRSFGTARDERGRDYGPLPADFIDTARQLFEEMAASPERQVLIHGDFHPQNILSSERDGWLAIDPKGVVGDPLFDAAVLIVEGPRHPTVYTRKAFLIRRIDQVAEELSVEPTLVARWCLAHRVLSGCWSFQDHGDGWQTAFSEAGLLKDLISRE